MRETKTSVSKGYGDERHEGWVGCWGREMLQDEEKEEEKEECGRDEGGERGEW